MALNWGRSSIMWLLFIILAVDTITCLNFSDASSTSNGVILKGFSSISGRPHEASGEGRGMGFLTGRKPFVQLDKNPAAFISNPSATRESFSSIRTRMNRTQLTDVSSPTMKAVSESSPVTALRAASPVVVNPAVEKEIESITDVNSVFQGKPLKDWTVERTMFQALHMATAEEMDRDPNVCVMGEDVGHYGGSYKVTKDLHYRYGNFRVMDTPICENTFVGMAIGAAMNGLRPIVEGMNMGFLLLAFNQISNNAGMVQYTSGGNFEVPMVIRGPGGIGKQLGPEHSQRIEAYLQAVPGLKLVACSTPRNARGLLKAAIRDNNPVVFFEHVLLYNLKEEIPLLPYTQALDKAEMVRLGSDITILSYSRMRHVAAQAAERLAKMGVNAEVLDLISIKPLDIAAIKKSISKTHRCLILDESSKTGGIGGEIFAQVVENCGHDLDDMPVRLCSKDIPTPYSKYLEEVTVVAPEDVVNAVIWMNSGRKGQFAPNSKLLAVA